MATISINGDSPGAPSPIMLRSWDEDFGALNAARTSGDDDDPVIYDDPNNAVTQTQADSIVGAGWHVTIA
jgi:hypothetical protein